jgi:hypothetical protein
MAKNKIKREHIYHAEAVVLSGHLTLPLVQEIKPQALSTLREHGGYLSQHAVPYRLEAVLSYQSAYTQVAGNRDQKPGHGWSTLTTSVIEGLNVMEVVTADRVVAQMATDHPLVGYVPTISFLGTRFENLRIAGHPVDLDVDLNVLGPKPANDSPYTSNADFLNRVAKQCENIRGCKSLPGDMIKRFTPAARPDVPEIECSLVNRAEGAFPGKSYGHVIQVPNFGKIYLGVLRIYQSDFKNNVPKKTLFDLTMIYLDMGCPGAGKLGLGNGVLNGASSP